VEHFGNYVEELSSRLGSIRGEYDDERRGLVDVRNQLKNSPGFCKAVSRQKANLPWGLSS